MVKYQIDTYYAIIYCGNGNTDVAKKLFTGVAEAVPNLNYSALAKKYLNSIESGMPVVFEEVLPNYGEKIVDPEAIIKKFRIIVLVCYICYIIIAGIIVIYPQIKDTLDSELHLTYEEKLDRAITAVNSEYTLLKSFEVSYSDGLVDVIGLVEANGKVDVGVFVTDDNGNPIEFLLNIKNTINNRVVSITQFYIDTPKTDKIIGYKVFNDKNDMTKTYLRTIEIDFNGEKVWLCINHIGKTFPEKDKYLENYYFRSEKS